MNPKVEVFLSKATKWREESEKLRAIILGCRLTEELKWGKPCYTFQESNIVIIQGFKEYCALMFCKGALLKDARGILVKPGENTQAARQVRFTNVREIVRMASILKAYIKEAIEVEKSGREVDFKAITELVFPAELQEELERNRAFRTAFEALTPGRQRAYNMFFSAPKQSETRKSRVEKCTPQILDGKGLNDDYKQREKKKSG